MENLIDKYITGFNKEDQKQMQELRAVVQNFAQSQEAMSYSMPSFKVQGGYICSFAMYKNHIGFYPYSGNITKLFKKELSQYKWSDGAVQFPKGRPLPKNLIVSMLQARLEEITEKTIYSYKCPKPLGTLEITLDTKEKVKTAVFVDKKSKALVLPKVVENALDNYFNKKKPLLQSLLSRDLAGTDFQKSIWAVICKTDFGETITYTDMAEMVGNSSAVRAAGTACGKNPIALFIPCHRVVRKQGEDYGYAWGPHRKKWLLEFEK